MSESLFIRRSIRSFLPSPVEWRLIERILSAGMHAPSAQNTQPWEFLVLTTPDARNKIARMSPYSKMAANAPVVILALADLRREPDEGWLAQGLSACCENMLLQIVEEGLCGVWLGIYPKRERMQALQGEFNLPDELLPFAAIPFGYSERINRPANRFDSARIHHETYKG